MKTIGQVLQQARQKKGLEIEEVARVTRIRENFLKDLEDDNYLKLPNATVTKGFIKNYGEFLGLSSNNLLAIFRRDFAENKQGQIIPRGIVDPVTKNSVWTPKNTVLATVSMLLTLFGAYLIIQLTNLLGPPDLKVEKPKSGEIISENPVQIAGRTDPEATLTINGQPVVLEKGGVFDVKISLEPDSQTVEIKAAKKNGKFTIINRVVNLTTPAFNQ